MTSTPIDVARLLFGKYEVPKLLSAYEALSA